MTVLGEQDNNVGPDAESLPHHIRLTAGEAAPGDGHPSRALDPHPPDRMVPCARGLLAAPSDGAVIPRETRRRQNHASAAGAARSRRRCPHNESVCHERELRAVAMAARRSAKSVQRQGTRAQAAAWSLVSSSDGPRAGDLDVVSRKEKKDQISRLCMHSHHTPVHTQLGQPRQ